MMRVTIHNKNFFSQLGDEYVPLITRSDNEIGVI